MTGFAFTLSIILSFSSAVLVTAQEVPPPAIADSISPALAPAPEGTAIADSLKVVPARIPAKSKPRLFAPAQYDSVLSLLSAGDSIRAAGGIIGIGLDTVSGDIVVVSFNEEGNPVRASFPVVVRNRAAAAPTIPSSGTKDAAARKLAQNGRTWFIIESTLKSAFTYPAAYGVIIPEDTNSSGQVIGGASLLTIGGMLYGAFAFTKNMELGYGKTAIMNYGSTALGNYYPFLVSSFLHNATKINDSYKSDNYQGYDSPTTTDHIRAWSSIVGFPLGIYLGSRWNIIDKDDYGKAAVMEYFSQTLGALAFTLPVFYYDHPMEEDKRYYLTASTALAMGFLPAGFYAGYKLTENKNVTAGRGTLPWVTGTMGALTGLGLASLSDKDYGIAGWRVLWASGIAGYGAGTYLGFAYNPSADYLFWQSVFIGAAAVCGGAIGEAFPLLANANNKRAYIIAAIAGSWTGFFLGERLSASLFEKTGRDKHASNLSVSLPLLAALPILTTWKKKPSARNGDIVTPIAAIAWSF